MKIRKALKSDIKRITEIYNEAIINTTATFDIYEKSKKQQQKWFNTHNEKFPVVVAETNGKVIGWASLSRYSKRAAYDNTSEISVYVHKLFRGRGAGKLLAEEIIKIARLNAMHVLVARIAAENSVSLSLAKKLGFSRIGILKEVGYKFDRFIDVVIMEMILN